MIARCLGVDSGLKSKRPGKLRDTPYEFVAVRHGLPLLLPSNAFASGLSTQHYQL